MRDDASDIAGRLADRAEAVCRKYLPAGRREGRYWMVGDVDNAPGRSLYVRLWANGNGKLPGKWTDAATGDHGDLLDLISANRKLATLRDVLDEARSFLALPPPEAAVARPRDPPAPTGSPEAALRLFAMSQPILGTVADAYLRNRAITDLRECSALRFHPRCWYRGDADDPRDRARDAWPAMIAAVTDMSGTITGAHRTWLDLSGVDKAPVSTPRRAMGHLLGKAVRFGRAGDIMVAGEGIETMLSLRQIMPTLPMMAALSANHLAALAFPAALRRLYIAQDDDPAGRRAVKTLTERVEAVGIEAFTLAPVLGDFNDDLRVLGREALSGGLMAQLVPNDAARLLISARS